MAITFACECGKTLRTRDELAGKKARCPQCSRVVTIPQPEPIAPVSAPASDEDMLYGLADSGPDESQSAGRDEPATPAPASSTCHQPKPRPAFAKAADPTMDEAAVGGKSSLMEYSYWLLAFALLPLMFSLLSQQEKTTLEDRFAQTIEKASPDEQERIGRILSQEEVSLDEAITVLPGHKLAGAHLAHDTSVHWIYAAIAAVGFLLLLGLFFSVERAQAMHLLGIGAFTGTVGIVFLLLVQFCSNFRLRRFHGRGVVVLVLLILTFIGWSYDSANDPDSNFLLSALGYTFGVGLCEEFTKAIPLFFYYKRDARMGWRGACVWGLASGIGFGVSEGIMYSARYYNGISGADIYLVRFVSCVALHAMWSASVGIAIARNVDAYEEVEDGTGFGLFMLRVLAVPMILHGFYDTLLKKEMNAWAFATALLSFGWLVWHIELARGSHPDAGRDKAVRKKLAY